MTGFNKVIHGIHYVAEALSWVAIAYSAFLLCGKGVLGAIVAIVALVVTLVVWALFASATALMRTTASVIIARAVVYVCAVGGLIFAELVWVGAVLAILIILTEGWLIWRKIHPALHPHSRGTSQIVAFSQTENYPSSPRRQARLVSEPTVNQTQTHSAAIPPKPPVPPRTPRITEE